MKAWCAFVGDPDGGAVLAFAKTRNKARQIGASWWPGNWEYLDVSARRAPLWDDIRDEETAIMDNEEISDGRPKFYTEDML